MNPITADHLLRFASGLEGERLTTLVRRAEFWVRVLPTALEITPESSRLPRLVPIEMMQRVCEEYQNSRSLRPGDYQGITFDASYLLAILDRYLREQGRA